jgi:hypothetical protein
MWDHINEALGEASKRVVTGVANFLPALLALLLAVLALSVVGWALGWLLGRLLQALDFDKRLHKWGVNLADWSPKNSPTLLFRRAVTWTLVVLGWLVGLTAFSAGVPSQLVASVVGYLPKVVMAFVIVALGGLLARFLARSVLIGAVNMQIQSARLLSVAARWLVLVFAVAMALDHLRIAADIVRVGFSILFGGIVLAVALAIGLGSKDLVSRSWEAHEKPKRTGEDPLRHV